MNKKIFGQLQIRNFPATIKLFNLGYHFDKLLIKDEDKLKFLHDETELLKEETKDVYKKYIDYKFLFVKAQYENEKEEVVAME